MKAVKRTRLLAGVVLGSLVFCAQAQNTGPLAVEERSLAQARSGGSSAGAAASQDGLLLLMQQQQQFEAHNVLPTLQAVQVLEQLLAQEKSAHAKLQATRQCVHTMCNTV